MLCKTSNKAEEFEIEINNGAFQNLDLRRSNATRLAFQGRDAFKDFFMSPSGAVPWQQEMVRRGRINEQ